MILLNFRRITDSLARLGLAALVLGSAIFAQGLYASGRSIEAQDPSLPIGLQIPKDLACQAAIAPEQMSERFITRYNLVQRHRESGLPITRVFLPSMTFDLSVIGGIKGIGAYESRGLHHMLARIAKEPLESLVIVMSTRMQESYIRYYLGLVLGENSPEIDRLIRDRLRVVYLDDPDLTPLTQKLLLASEKLQQVKSYTEELNAIARDNFLSSSAASRFSPDQVYSQVMIDPILSSMWEGYATLEMNAAINGNPMRNARLEVKSETRRLAREAGIVMPDGHEDLMSERELAEAVLDLLEKGHRRLKIKKNSGTSGKGNADIRFTEAQANAFIRRMRYFSFTEGLRQGNITSMVRFLSRNLEPVDADLTPREFIESFSAKGGIVEQYIPNILKDEEGRPVSPSVQADITPTGCDIVGTHDQKFMPGTEDVFAGGIFPATSMYHDKLIEMMNQLCPKLIEYGVIGRIAVDTVASKNPDSGEIVLWGGIDFNVRKGGTHPIDMLRILTDARRPIEGEPDALWVTEIETESGTEVRELFYESTDNFLHDGLETFAGDFQSFFEFVKSKPELLKHLYDPATKEGIVFHLAPALKNGKVGFSYISNSSREQNHLDYTEFESALTEALNQRL